MPLLPPRFTRPTKAYAGYIFDCDGTLADTMPMHFAAWKHALLAAGAGFPFTWDLFVSRSGMSLEATVIGLNQQFGVALDPVLVAENQRVKYRTIEQSTAAVPGMLEYVREVARIAPVAVASGSSRRNVDETLRLIGAEDVFQVICTPEDVTHGKPDPETFLLAASRMGVPPQQCVVFEDGQLGIEAAARANMDCVVVAPDPNMTIV